MKIKKGKSALFLTHQNADPDGIASVYFLSKRFGGDIGLPAPPGRFGKRLVDFLGMDYKINPDISQYDKIIILDTPDPKQLSPIEIRGCDYQVIDHHSTHHWEKTIDYRERTSCAEIVYEIVDPAELTKKEAIALSSGILSDTSNLRRADWRTLSILSEILKKSDISLEEVREVINDSRSFSEKICRLKGAKRLSFKKIKGYLIAFTNVSSFESSVSSMLIFIGADVGFTVSKREKRLLLSGRAKELLITEGLDLGDIFKEICEGYPNLTGGGHPGAAIIKGKGDADEILEICIRKTINFISESELERTLD
ncbi:MAG: DHH family phosphoesterase [Thermoplasmatota archaeon]